MIDSVSLTSLSHKDQLAYKSSKDKLNNDLEDIKYQFKQLGLGGNFFYKQFHKKVIDELISSREDERTIPLNYVENQQEYLGCP